MNSSSSNDFGLTADEVLQMRLADESWSRPTNENPTRGSHDDGPSGIPANG